jgi:acetyl-CoA acyltransferase 2
MSPPGIFIVAAKRTPFGAFGGALAKLSATELGVVATKAALISGKVDPSLVDNIFFGNVIQSSPDAAYLARHVGLKAFLYQPSLSIACSAVTIKVGDSQAGGTENISAAPLRVDGNAARWGWDIPW